LFSASCCLCRLSLTSTLSLKSKDETGSNDVFGTVFCVVWVGSVVVTLNAQLLGGQM
jgi:hypothetical protein